MILFTDDQLRDELLYQGYNVPMIVIRTWGSPNHHSCGFAGTDWGPNRRIKVERWLRFMRRDKKSRVTPFPQFIAAFDIQIRRRVERHTSECQKSRTA